MSPFCGATDTPVLDFWWRLLWVSKSEWVLPYLSLVEAYVLHYMYLRFTSGVTPADLLVASMAAKPSPHTCEALVGLETRSYPATAHSVRSGRHSTDWAIPARLGSVNGLGIGPGNGLGNGLGIGLRNGSRNGLRNSLGNGLGIGLEIICELVYLFFYLQISPTLWNKITNV